MLLQVDKVKMGKYARCHEKNKLQDLQRGENTWQEHEICLNQKVKEPRRHFENCYF